MSKTGNQRDEWSLVSPISVVFFFGKHSARLPEWLLQHSHLPAVLLSFGVMASVYLKVYWLWIVVLGGLIFFLLFGLLLAAFLTYVRFRYRVSDDVLVVREGVFRVVQTDVPWSQVRAINIRRKPVERLANLATISVDTAGTSKAEIQIPALRLALAQSLRDKATNLSSDSAKEADRDMPTHALYRMSTKDLLLASLCSSGAMAIVAGCIVFGSLFLFCSLLSGLNLDPAMYQVNSAVQFVTQGMSRVFEQFQSVYLTIFEAVEQITGIALTRSWFSMLLGTIGLLIVAVLVFFLATFVFCFTSNFNLHLQRRKDDLSISRGLLTTRHSSLSPKKIQNISLRMNFREVLFQIGELTARQSTSGRDHRLVIPSCPAHIRQQVRDEVFGSVRSRLKLEPHASEITRISPIYFLQVFFNHMIAMFIVGATTWFLFLLSGNSPTLTLWLLFWIPCSLTVATIRWRKAGYACDSEMILSKQGLLGYKLTMGRLGKVQRTSIKQNAIQRFTGKSTLTLHFATSNIEIPFVQLAVAQQLTTYVLHFVETKAIHWE